MRVRAEGTLGAGIFSIQSIQAYGGKTLARVDASQQALALTSLHRLFPIKNKRTDPAIPYHTAPKLFSLSDR